MFEICWYDVLNPTMGFLDTQILKTHKQLVSYNYCQNTNLETNLSKLLIECHVFLKPYKILRVHPCLQCMELKSMPEVGIASHSHQLSMEFILISLLVQLQVHDSHL